MNTFFLGTHQPAWLRSFPHPLFVSVRRLRDYKTWPRAAVDWALDSGGFSELSMFGRWTVGSKQYADEVRRAAEEIGRLIWAAQQDWMCESLIIARTGLSVAEHQRRTVANYLELVALAPDLPWVPVLQGWTYGDYLDHVEQFDRAGVDLRTLPVVGVGSVCRRQDTTAVECLLRDLDGMGIRCHGFGFKIKGLTRSARHLESADSMAWSFAARRRPPLAGCESRHKNCANCPRFAEAWHGEVMKAIGSGQSRPLQGLLF